MPLNDTEKREKQLDSDNKTMVLVMSTCSTQ